MIPYHNSKNFALYQGDSLKLLNQLNLPVDMIFADPPYFLSTGNGTVNINGEYIKFDKGQWDHVRSQEEKDKFNLKWLSACCKLLKETGTIWICGTYHNIFSVEKCLDKLEFKIINMIVWQKPDPPTTLSDKRFNFSTEYLIWATRKRCCNYIFNKEALMNLNGGLPMQDVWRISAAASWEKKYGKHPTQKPLRLLYRAILASTNEGDVILDPFSGSSTTGIAANLMKRSFIGLEINREYLDLGIRRRDELNNSCTFSLMRRRMEENPKEVMVLVNHARPELKEQMIKLGICYTRVGDSKGSVLITYGFERMQYVLIHTNGLDAHMYKLRKKGCFQIWSKETLIKYGFNPQISPYYAVFLFDNTVEYPISKHPNLQQKINTYRAKIRPLIDFCDD